MKTTMKEKSSFLITIQGENAETESIFIADESEFTSRVGTWTVRSHVT